MLASRPLDDIANRTGGTEGRVLSNVVPATPTGMVLGYGVVMPRSHTPCRRNVVR